MTAPAAPFLIDLHVHTRVYSPCSRIDPAEAIARAREAGLSAIVLTEHGYRWSEDELAGLRASANGLRVLAGAEITTREGDLLVLGVDDVDSLDAYSSAEDVLSLVRARKGFAIWAHPFRFGEPADVYARKNVPDAIEIASSNMTPEVSARARRLAAELGVLTVTASDAHRPDAVGRYPFALPRPVENERELVACLRELAAR